MFTLVLRSAIYHWRTNVAVLFGVASAVAVLAGALVVGDSVRGSLRDIALGRLGRTDVVVSSGGFFREALADDLRAGGGDAAPMIVANGFVTLERSRRRASNVLVYGVDERFWRFHGLAPIDDVRLSPALAAELEAQPGDVLLTRVQKPSAIPLDSLFGRKDDIGRTMRLESAGALPAARLGEFALLPQQSEVRAVFAPLQRIQRDLALASRVNTVLLAGGAERVASRLKLDDLGVRVNTVDLPDGSAMISVEGEHGIVNEALDAAARSAGERAGLTPIPAFTYLANGISKEGASIPYSLVTAIDAPLGAGGAAIPSGDGIVLNDWAARELHAARGDRVSLEYYLWDPAAGLQTKSATFVVSDVVPIAGLAADRRLAPEYPGITTADNLADWDPPFPVDLSKVRPVDEAYWHEYRTTPKAFISYEKGRELWQSGYGAATSIRFRPAAAADAASVAERLRNESQRDLPAPAMGVTIVPIRDQALQASTGATDFGEYFTYFSFFIVVSALLLVVLFFKLGIEQRLRQIGVLRASGFPVATIGRLLLTEAICVSLAGGVLGVLGAVLYARLIVHGLRTWWVGAVGTTLLEVHLAPATLAAGALGGMAAAVVCVLVTLRGVRKASPRALLGAQALDAAVAPDARRARRVGIIALVFGHLGAAALAVGFLRPSLQTGAFFGAGAAWLIGGLALLSAWLRSRDRRVIGSASTFAVPLLGLRSATFRPSRSVMSAALIASAAFIIVSIDAFRRAPDGVVSDHRAGTGGYVLLAQSELPLLHDPNSAAGREELLIDGPELAAVQFARFRLRRGQDASCLNLYRPTNPTIIAPAPGFVESNRFTFAASAAESDAERANPWLLLNREATDGTIPVIADATSLQYVLHAAVGDTMSIDNGGGQPVVLRFVGALSDSVLQGQLVMSERQFTRLFPSQQGYQFFLIDAPAVTTTAAADALAGIVESELDEFGMDAVSTSERLAAFHRVENTYLSTFQALGGLGLLLGTIGLATVMFRNVLERRRELALLRAVGYGTREVSTMILAEAALLLFAGLLTGIVCALLAIAPAWFGRGGVLPGRGLVLLLSAVALAGLLSALIATRAALRSPLVSALKAE